MEDKTNQFEKENKKDIDELVKLLKKKKDIETKEKGLKDKIKKSMGTHNVNSFKSEKITISSAAGSTTKTIDLEKLEEKEPQLYKDLLKDYPKTTTRSGSIKFSLPKSK